MATVSINPHCSGSPQRGRFLYFKYNEADGWQEYQNSVSVGIGENPTVFFRLIYDWERGNVGIETFAFNGTTEPRVHREGGGVTSTILKWTAKEIILRADCGGVVVNDLTIDAYSAWIANMSLDSALTYIDGAPWYFEPYNSNPVTLRLRANAPATLSKTNPPILTDSDGVVLRTENIWNDSGNGWNIKYTAKQADSRGLFLRTNAEVNMATEKYGAFGDLGKSLSVTPVSTDTVIAVLARGKTNMNAVTFADLSAYLNDKPINPNDACDMCAYALYATAGVNNVVWCGGTDLAACIKTFQDYMTRTPQVSCIVIDGGFTTTKEDAATILAGIKKIDGHWDATAILNCNAAQDHTGKPCSSEDAVVTMGFIKTGANILPLSAIRAGLCARSDAEYGAPARSGGNLPIPNAEAWGSYDSNNFTAMPISETLATSLSAEGVCAVVNYSGTYRTWGDHTSLFAAGTITDERARFDNSIRMLRSITNRFQLKYRASIDSPFTLQMRNDIINEQLDYLNGLVAKGALIGKPTCEFRAIDNPKDNIQKGEFKWNITCTTTNPLKYAYVSVSYTSAGLDSLVEEG